MHALMRTAQHSIACTSWTLARVAMQTESTQAHRSHGRRHYPDSNPSGASTLHPHSPRLAFCAVNGTNNQSVRMIWTDALLVCFSDPDSSARLPAAAVRGTPRRTMQLSSDIAWQDDKHGTRTSRVWINGQRRQRQRRGWHAARASRSCEIRHEPRRSSCTVSAEPQRQCPTWPRPHATKTKRPPTAPEQRSNTKRHGPRDDARPGVARRALEKRPARGTPAGRPASVSRPGRAAIPTATELPAVFSSRPPLPGRVERQPGRRARAR